MTDETKKQIKEDYGKGMSPFMLSHKYHVEVYQVYEAIEQPNMNYVQVSGGDMVDNVGPGATVEGPKIAQQPYTKN